jgi:hypothetical protein
MKKTALIFVLLLCFAFVSVATQEEDNTAEAEMDEAAIMYMGLGAQVRLLQLEKSITRNYLYGDKVVQYIKDNSLNISEDVLNAMEDIVSELKDVKDSVAEEIDKEPGETTVETFVDLKDRAINLTQEFRSLVRDYLTVEQRQAIKNSVDKKDFSELDDLNEQIRNRVREFNKERVRDMLNYLNITDEELLQRVESGNITAIELRKLVMDKFREQTQERKREFLQNAQEERKKVQLMKHVAFARKVGLSRDDIGRIKNIVNDNSITAQEMRAKLGAFVKEKTQEKKETMNEIRNRLKEAVQVRTERLSNLREAIQAKRGGAE